jgi:predicted negative regulator of RcsB-dependent stress response
VTSGLNLDNVIADLDLAIRSSPSNYMLHQVKGDAMMKDGRLQGALEAYRQALAKLAS